MSEPFHQNTDFCLCFLFRVCVCLHWESAEPFAREEMLPNDLGSHANQTFCLFDFDDRGARACVRALCILCCLSSTIRDPTRCTASSGIFLRRSPASHGTPNSLASTADQSFPISRIGPWAQGRGTEQFLCLCCDDARFRSELVTKKVDGL
ncbi:unnamed protein product [Cercospora beticola]|nr:unnamed protein product [Cercospora beticola]